jgi:hypothetical protein
MADANLVNQLQHQADANAEVLHPHFVLLLMYFSFATDSRCTLFSL